MTPMHIAFITVTDSEIHFVGGDLAFDFDSWATLLNFLRQTHADAADMLFISFQPAR